MKTRPKFPLLAKVLVWLLLHLTIIALAFLGFMGWQLGLGLDSLLSGAAGERLRVFGDSARAEIIDLPRGEWNAAVKPLAEAKNVVAGFYDPGNPESFPVGLPANVVEKLGSPTLPRPGPPERGVPSPRPRGEGDFRGRHDGPRDREPRDVEGNRPPTRPVFLMRGAGGDGYWAGIELHLGGSPGRPPRPAVLLIRSDRMDGSGMFFEVRPWLLGGLAVLVLSLAFWTPFVWKITRYINGLTVATERIAAGDFQISLPPRGNDELGNLGHAVKTMAGRLDHLILGQKRFMGDAAHELCAPLARMRTGIGILEMSLAENLRPRLAQIEEEAEELATLVEEILAFSRAENRALVLRAIDLEQLVHEVIAKEGGGCELDLRVPKKIMVLGDHGLLGRALGNLVRNVKVHAGPEAKAIIAAEERGNLVEISVTDDGPGVSDDELPRIFEPFYRPDRSRSRDTGGSGLGLAIVRSAVEACHGELMASLPPSGGFSVTLILKKFPLSPPKTAN